MKKMTFYLLTTIVCSFLVILLYSCNKSEAVTDAIPDIEVSSAAAPATACRNMEMIKTTDLDDVDCHDPLNCICPTLLTIDCFTGTNPLRIRRVNNGVGPICTLDFYETWTYCLPLEGGGGLHGSGTSYQIFFGGQFPDGCATFSLEGSCVGEDLIDVTICGVGNTVPNCPDSGVAVDVVSQAFFTQEQCWGFTPNS